MLPQAKSGRLSYRPFDLTSEQMICGKCQNRRAEFWCVLGFGWPKTSGGMRLMNEPAELGGVTGVLLAFYCDDCTGQDIKGA